MSLNSVDPSAKTARRIRRNWGRTIKGSVTQTLNTSLPITIDSQDRVAIDIATAGGMNSSADSLQILLSDTSLAVGSSGTSVNLATSPGLTVSSGLKVLLDPTDPCLQLTSGLKVTVNAAGALTQTTTGLEVAVDDSTINISTNKLAIKSGGVGLTQLGALTTKGDLLGFSTTHARLAVGSDTQILTADSTQATGMKWADAPTSLASPLTTKGDVWTFGTADARLPVGTDGQVLTAASSETVGVKWSDASAGTVTSVGLTAPSIFTVINSPVTTSDTIIMALASVSKNHIWCGPASGSDASPDFRLMVAADLPGGAWMTATAGEAVLASDFSLDLTSANNGVYQSPTLSVSLDPGTYFIMGIANCQLFAQFGFQLRIRLFNSTTSAAITSTEAKGVFRQRKRHKR